MSQETQLSLTNRATRLKVSQLQATKHGTIRYVRYGFLLLPNSNFVHKTKILERFDFKNAVTLKTGLGIREDHNCHHCMREYDFLLTFYSNIWLYLVLFLRY